MTIKNNIKPYRAQHNLTQEELAKGVKVTRETIISLEKGSYIPSLELAMIIISIKIKELEKN